jgi:glycerol-3-phosphate acyltransferase PlsY
MVPFLIVLALLIFWRHTENIQRLLKGTEGKIRSK